MLGLVLGCGERADSFHRTRSNPDGGAIIGAMRSAIADAGLAPDRIDYVNAHGTGTTMNDELETVAIKTAFGGDARRLAISSTKSRTGHLLGAAGALEAVIAIQALEDGILPSTLNLETPDPACDLDYLPGAARPASVDVAMSNSMGFGGHNVSLVFRKHADE